MSNQGENSGDLPHMYLSPLEADSIQTFLHGFLACFDNAYTHDSFIELFGLMIDKRRLGASPRATVQELATRILHEDALPAPSTSLDERQMIKVALQKTRAIRALGKAFPNKLRDQFTSAAANDPELLGRTTWLYHLEHGTAIWRANIIKLGEYGGVARNDLILIAASNDGVHKALCIPLNDGSAEISNSIGSDFWSYTFNSDQTQLRMARQWQLVASNIYLPVPKLHG